MNTDYKHPEENRAADSQGETRQTIPVENVEAGTTPVERVMGRAKEQATVAADAFRRGQFIQDAGVDNEANGDDRLIGMLCYLIPVAMPILVLLSESGKRRTFQRYHAIQSLGLSTVLVVLSLAFVIGVSIAFAIPLIGWLIGVLALCFSPIGFLMVLVAHLYYSYQSFQGKIFSIPGLTSFLRDQGWL